MKIFKDEQDYRIFLSRLKENLFPGEKCSIDSLVKRRCHTPYVRKNLPSGSFTLIAYCLMPNHFHLLIRQNTDISVSKLILKICSSYSKYFNLKYKRVGSIFQDQFKSVLVDSNEYLLWLSTYIHLNPRISGLIKEDKDWKWGSYREYLDLNTDKLCNKEIIYEQIKDIGSYKNLTEQTFENIRQRKYAAVETDFAEFNPPDGAHQGDK